MGQMGCAGLLTLQIWVLGQATPILRRSGWCSWVQRSRSMFKLHEGLTWVSYVCHSGPSFSSAQYTVAVVVQQDPWSTASGNIAPRQPHCHTQRQQEAEAQTSPVGEGSMLYSCQHLRSSAPCWEWRWPFSIRIPLVQCHSRLQNSGWSTRFSAGESGFGQIVV